MDVTCHVCIGGTNAPDDIKRFEEGVQIIVGTPGRVYNMLTQINERFRDSHIGCENIKILVIDEIDEILSRGFKDLIHDTFKILPQNMQIIVLSTTFPNEVLEETAKLVKDPIKIIFKREQITLEGIQQFYVNVEHEVKNDDILSRFSDLI